MVGFTKDIAKFTPGNYLKIAASPKQPRRHISIEIYKGFLD